MIGYVIVIIHQVRLGNRPAIRTMQIKLCKLNPDPKVTTRIRSIRDWSINRGMYIQRN